MNLFVRLAAILVIYIGATIAWIILGATIQHRTQQAANTLQSRVANTWGSSQEQSAPTASWTTEVPRRTTVADLNNKPVEKIETVTITEYLPLESSKIQADLQLEHRQKGLRWYSTYQVAFAGDYVFRNDTPQARQVLLRLPFPATQAIYDDLQFTVNGQPAVTGSDPSGVSAPVKLAPGETATLRVSYRSQGLDQWRYQFARPAAGGETSVAKVKDFTLRMTTNFRQIDFPDNTLSPSTKRETPAGWALEWNYCSLVSGYQIAMVMPERLQPGPLAGEIALFAPVSLFFFFFILLVITTMRGLDLHPMNYFFLAAAFFAFHLLLAYLVDLIDLHVAFVIASAVSVFLVVSYLRIVAGLRFAALEAGGAQLIYLVLFSYAFFFQGLTGITVTVGSILTLFAVMQWTARLNWTERFSRRPALPPPLGATDAPL
jgi:inner membrane protein involved in colicin E2 resistance